MCNFFLISSAPVMAAILLLMFSLSQLFSIFTSSIDLPKLDTLTVDKALIDNASRDFGRMSRLKPSAVLLPVNTEDVTQLVRWAYQSDPPMTLVARGNGHSINGQALSNGGIAIYMNSLKGFHRKIGSLPAPASSEFYADVSGGDLWIDVLHYTFKHGLSPRSWTDYLYLTVGGTLSNGGISGQTFNHGPQINNVYELDVITGKGENMRCSEEENSELFHGVLGGLGQFGIITRARIALEPAPERFICPISDWKCIWDKRCSIVFTKGQIRKTKEEYPFLRYTEKAKNIILSLGDHVEDPMLSLLDQCNGTRKLTFKVRWIRVLYSDFSSFTTDQEYLISLHDRSSSKKFDYVEGFVIVDEGLTNNWRSSFFSLSNPVKLSSIRSSSNEILYCLELAKNYNKFSANTVDQEVESLLKKLNFIPSSVFTTDILYVDFLDRVHTSELKLRSEGLWEVPHPWLNLFVPKSQIGEFDNGVFKGILRSNKTTGPILIYPMNKSKWNSECSVMTPDDDIFYLIAFLRSALDSADETQSLEYLTHQNQEILRFCEESGIKIKMYLPHYKTKEEWKSHFGDKWERFVKRKMEFDPKGILSPGPMVFNDCLAQL